MAEANFVTTFRSDNGGDGFTVFAPTDEAFAALAAVPGGQDLVDVLTSGNTVNVVLTDVPAANGVIHVIDGVLLPGR